MQFASNADKFTMHAYYEILQIRENATNPF